jgi:hypothetical protein
MSDEDTISRALLMRAVNGHDSAERLVRRELLTGALLERKGRPVVLPDNTVVALNRDLDGPAWLVLSGSTGKYDRMTLGASKAACEARWGAGCWGGWPEGGAA